MGWRYTVVRKLGKTQLTGIELRLWGSKYWEQIQDIINSHPITMGHVAAHHKMVEFALSTERFSKWLNEWFGHTGAYDLHITG